MNRNIAFAILGFRYGATLVPFSEEDMAKVKEPTEKCLSVIGFTQAENVSHTSATYSGCCFVESCFNMHACHLSSFFENRFDEL